MNYSLTSAGVSDQLAALYRLTDSELETESTAIRNDFKTWMVGHFILTATQSLCLNKMSANTLQDYGDMCCLAVRNRLDIVFEDPTTAPPAGHRKFVIADNNTKTKNNADGTSTVTGTLRFIVGYEPM